MKTVILCGGRGLRMGADGARRPKALVEIGGQPMIWHVMRQYARCGFRDFLLCLGYKGDVIRQFFLDHRLDGGDRRLETRSDPGSGEAVRVATGEGEDWRITFVDTGLDTQTGGRIRRVAPYVDGDRFFATYADGVSDVNLAALLAFHLRHGAVATVTGVHPPSPFGILEAEGPWVTEFSEKLPVGQTVNGGYFVFDRAVFDYLDDDDCILEQEPLRRLASERRLAVYEHGGFWACVDTPKDVYELERLWREGRAGWRP